ncbi:hypothetical protein ACFFX1_51405 [Dactylosporangium sucinum]|uniref:Uncharacterized protein n=1 Tax=Dactylosporangium sucinum TaxID=1424081 RepID=A0A917X2S3_9ACTN|nr:hypothetical protein [Dactylosporangium sucinum]GGM58367.1 hypothetical protein GCM10007977_069970 [Dactylosporangium sucinum]
MAGQRTIAARAVRQESDVLLRQLDTYLAALRSGRPEADVDHAERVAAALRRLIAETSGASAVDRARVRAAVHYFVYQGHQRPARGGARLTLLTGGRAAPERRRNDHRVVNDLLRELGRPDLVVADPPST